MSTINGTVAGVQLIDDAGTSRKTYRVGLNFGAYTGSSDSAAFVGVGAAITADRKDGKTRTLRSGCGGAADKTQGIYAGPCTVSGADLTFDLVGITGTEIISTTGTTSPIGVIVTVDES